MRLISVLAGALVVAALNVHGSDANANAIARDAAAAAAAAAAAVAISAPLTTPAPILILPRSASTRLAARAPAPAQKRPKYTRPKARKHRRPRPLKHSRGCDTTELLANGDFDRSVRGWTAYSGATGLATLFWVRDSRQRPAHSPGGGQAYVFLNRGPAIIDFETVVPAVEYGNAISISMWMRYEAPANLTGCYAYWAARGADAYVDVVLTPQWTRYSFEAPGLGRAQTLRFVMQCDYLPTPVSILLDDVSAKACVPRRPDPECQVVRGADNLLVNPGFECPDGITAWETSSYVEGSEELKQFGVQQGNAPHSGSGMGGFVFDNSLPPGFSGMTISQINIPGDLTRQSMKASLWLSVDAQMSNTTGCELSFATRTGVYLYAVDLSKLTTKWTKFEVKDIEPDSLDDLRIDIAACGAPVLPIIYIDDIYFGIDRSSPAATSTVVTEPTTTPTAGPCTSTPSVADPSIELNDNMNNWISSNGDIMIFPDADATYGPPHDGRAVAVLQFPPAPERQSVSLSQYVSGLCGNQAYTASVWLYVPAGYDPRRCQFRLGLTGASDLFNVSRAGAWEKLELIFYVEAGDVSNPFLAVRISAFCDSATELIVLVDDLRFGPAPPCSVTSTIADGSFESGNVTRWDAGPFQGDETFAITTARPRTGSRSAVLTFPSISNGLSFVNNFDACVGTKYTFRLWYYVPRAYRGITCTVNTYAYFTGESSQTVIATYDAWTVVTLDFVAGGKAMTIVWSVVCGNQLQKVVIYIDDVSVTKKQ